MSKLNTNAIKKRFEKLISLNIEGIASTEENLELWQILRRHENLKSEFIQTRNIHYLLKVSQDPSVSAMVFTDGFKDSPRASGPKEEDFFVSVRNRLDKEVRKKKKRQFPYPALKIAASILIIFGCAALLKNYFYQTQARFPEITQPEETYLTWNYEPEIVRLKKNITMFYSSPTPTTYLYTVSENEIVNKINAINKIIDRNEKLWP